MSWLLMNLQWTGMHRNDDNQYLNLRHWQVFNANERGNVIAKCLYSDINITKHMYVETSSYTGQSIGKLTLLVTIYIR